MPIVLVRVDDRLIHGQILEGWLPSTRAQELIVANDSLAQDYLQKMIMQSAIPYSINLIIDSVDGIASFLREQENTDVRRMIIVDNPVDALRLKHAGVRFAELNLGNVISREVTVCLSRTVSLGGDSLCALRRILKEGIRVKIQAVPYEDPLVVVDV
jgi:mannose/fructose/N-acetylgalactosamine-specific phosphotransferase system component IIB